MRNDGTLDGERRTVVYIHSGNLQALQAQGLA